MNDLYRNELRLWMNVFQPSVKLLREVRVGSRLPRIYEAARTPLTGHADGNDVQRDGTFQNEAVGCTLTPAQDSKMEILAGSQSVGIFWAYKGTIWRCKIAATRSRQNEKTLAWVLGLHGVGIILACHHPFADALEPNHSPNNLITFCQYL